MPLPGLSNNERKFFLGIKEGKITYRPGNNEEPEKYDNFDGILKNITKREANINGSPVMFYDFLFENSGQGYILSVPMSSGVARNIILSLANIQNFVNSIIRISPYLSKRDSKYTNVAVYCNGQNVKWVTDKLPAIKDVVVGSKVIKDDSELVAFIETQVGVINDRLHRIVDPETGECQGPVVDVDSFDMPGDMPDDLG